MRIIPHFIIAVCAAITMLSFPVSSVYSADASSKNTPDKPWVWPLAPEKPRVQHIKTFITPQDLGVKKGFFAKLWEFIAGEDAADRIISPHGVTADGNGRVYVADWGGKCIHFFDFEKKKYDKFSETKLGKLASPIGMALDDDGLLYVTDSALRRVFVFNGTKNKRVIGEDNSLLRPTGVAVNAREKRLYVADTLGHRVDVFTLEGEKQFSFGKRGTGDGEFNYPTHIAIDPAGTVYVMDTLNFRVQVFDKDGTFITLFGQTGTGIHDFIKPKGIAVDSEGHVWVSDEIRNSIQVFDRKGKLLLIFGKTGIGRGEFNMPAGLFFDNKDRLYVADSYNYRVQMFQYLKQ
jgi:DNA-binding beta-propeller fold protein YncE